MDDSRLKKLFEYHHKHPDDPFINHAIGVEYVRLNDDKRAQVFFENVIDNHPNYVGTYYQLAKLYERQEKWGNALEVYSRGMAVAQATGDNHAHRELQGAKQMLQDDLEE